MNRETNTTGIKRIRINGQHSTGKCLHKRENLPQGRAQAKWSQNPWGVRILRAGGGADKSERKPTEDALKFENPPVNQRELEVSRGYRPGT